MHLKSDRSSTTRNPEPILPSMLMTVWGLVGVKVTAHSTYMPRRSGE